MKKVVKLGSGSESWGASWIPAVELCERGDIDYIGFDHLAELTMSLLVRQRQRRPDRGYVRDVLTIMQEALPHCKKRGIKVITNGGGANPEECAKEVLKIAKDIGWKDCKVGVVTGDELPLEKLDKLLAQGMKFPNRDTGAQDLREIRDRMVAAHVYIGSEGVIEALKRGADVVVAGRISDNALYVGPVMYEFGWDYTEPYRDRIDAAVTAGHVVECALCVCGCMSTQWRLAGGPEAVGMNVGYPIIEFHDNGDFFVTKMPDTGGVISEWTVKEHLVYEVHDPHNYLMPDGVADFTKLTVEEVGKDRVKVSGACGKPRPEMLKLCVGYEDGWIGEGMFMVGGPDTIAKAKYSAGVVMARLKKMGLQALETRLDYIGVNALFGEVGQWPKEDPQEMAIRVAAKTKTQEEAYKVRRAVTHMWDNGPEGNEVGVPLDPRPVVNLWHTLIPRSEVPTEANILE